METVTSESSVQLLGYASAARQYLLTRLRASAHTECISCEALARVGLPTAKAPTRTSEIRFVHSVGATGCTKRQSATCIGRDHRRAQAKPLL